MVPAGTTIARLPGDGGDEVEVRGTDMLVDGDRTWVVAFGLGSGFGSFGLAGFLARGVFHLTELAAVRVTQSTGWFGVGRHRVDA